MVCDPSPSLASCNSVERRLTQRGVFLQLSFCRFPPAAALAPRHFISLPSIDGQVSGSQHMKFKFDAPHPSAVTHRPSGQPPPVADNAIWAFCIASSGGSMSFYYYFYCAVIFCHPAPQKGQLAGPGQRQEKGQGQWPRQGAGVGGVHINAT